MYNKPININIQWGQFSNAISPSVEKIKNGWNGNEKPSVEHMNWILNRVDNAIGYFMQGVRWQNDIEYPVNEIVNHNGILYRCKVLNKGKAVTDTTHWEVAFYPNLGGADLAAEIKKIKEQDGYLSKYLTVSNPVTTARMTAGSYQAGAGLSTASSYNTGYSFSGGYNTTGMYLNGSTLTFRVNGTTKATIPLAEPSLNDKTTTIATTDWVQRLIEQKIGTIDITAGRLPVGFVFICIGEQNPAALLGYGTWVRFAEGQTLVGKSTNSTHPAWTKTTLSAFGAYTHQLTRDELPSLPAAAAGQWLKATGGSQSLNRSGGYSQHYNKPEDLPVLSGKDVPHNNVQPSITVNMWRRTA